MELYQNPIKRHGDFADPFILRYNGKYYLYATNPDIRCWSSEDLMSWAYEGPVITPETFPGLVPFAPEVVYWNGAFYMYTSPHGRGHYVLTSERPTGPFRKITENVGHSIDGSVFIDDDGKWYFYWADDSGILGCEMRSPTEFGEPVHTGAYLHGWTEGPMVVTDNGMYYMTFTGNHYLSRGYRIHAAVSAQPLTGYCDCPNNPIIVRAEGSWTGLGHSSTVVGPNMLTHFIAYHNINEDLTRDLNIDPLILGSRVRVAGPSTLPQPVPEMPNFADRSGTDEVWEILTGNWSFQNDLLRCSQVFRSRCRRALDTESGVIEFHLQAGTGIGSYGVDIGDIQIELATDSNGVTLCMRETDVCFTYDIPYSFVHQALHCLQVRYRKGCLSLRIDGRHAGDYPLSVNIGDRIGYYASGSGVAVGYTAFHGGDSKYADERLFHPVPCSIPLEGQPEKTIRLNLAETGNCFLAVVCNSVESQAELKYVADGETQTAHLLMASRDTAIYTLSLTGGLNELSFCFGEGLHAPSALIVQPQDQHEDVREEIEHYPSFEKRCYGSARGPVAEATLDFPDSLSSGTPPVGILLSASELAYGGEGQDKELGQNFFIGYCVSIVGSDLVLTKHRYDETELARVSLDTAAFPIRQLRAVQLVNDITVFANGNNAPLLSYHDGNPILFGKAGIRAKFAGIKRAVFHSVDGGHATYYGGQHDQPTQK